MSKRLRGRDDEQTEATTSGSAWTRTRMEVKNDKSGHKNIHCYE